MDWSSWFRRALLKDNIKATIADPSKANDPPPSSKKQSRLKKSDFEEHGITEKLVDLVWTFTVDTFRMTAMNLGGTLRVVQLLRRMTREISPNGKRGMPAFCSLESRNNHSLDTRSAHAR